MRSPRRAGERTTSRGLSVAHGLRPDQDRVARGAYGVDPVEVGVVGEQQARRRVADVAVDRHAAREQGVRAVTHPWLLSGARPPATRAGRAVRAAAWRRAPRERTPPPRTSGARQAGDEHHDAVGDRRRDALAGPEPRGGERPAGRALARPPAGDARQHHGRHREERERQQPRQRRGGSGRARRDQERGRMADHDERRRRARSPAPLRARAGCRGRRRRPRGGRAPAASRRRPGHARPASSTAAAAATSATATSGMDERTGDGSAMSTHDGEDDLHDLAAGAFPRHGPQRAADIACVAPVG